MGVNLLPHAFVNIPDKKMHIGVFIFILIIYLVSFFNILNFIHIYLFIVFLSNCNCNTY
jgi:hypothetical protein